MVSSIDRITKEKYQALKLKNLFEEKITDRAFATILINNVVYKFAWGSDIVKPVIKIINNQYCTIGIDLEFIVINMIENTVIDRVKLNFFYYDTQVFNNFLFVITELQILKMSKQSFKIIDKIDLPDIFESFDVTDQGVLVTCFNDYEVLIQI
ncbi:hypothetical protein [Myroides odoratus]|uniref:hypothetical protein n=1 Tax=Myroides odoratus TaxID=256 RepID=UPI0039AEDEB0